MRLGYGLTIEQTQKLTMTPELIQAIRILQFNTQELDSFVQEEILENPVLEFDKKHVESLAALQENLSEDYEDPGFKQWQYSKDKEEYSFEQFTSKEETLEDAKDILTLDQKRTILLEIGEVITKIKEHQIVYGDLHDANVMIDQNLNFKFMDTSYTPDS